MKKLLFLLLTINCSLLTAEAQWVQVNNGMGNLNVLSLAANVNTIFAGTDINYGVYLSTNNGTSWTHTSLIQSVNALAVGGNYVFAGTYGGVFLSTNNGTTWTQTSLINRYVWSLAQMGNYIFAGTADTLNNGRVYLSTNNGITWTQTSFIGPGVASLSVSGNNNVFAGIYTGGVYVSNNNGTSWAQRNEGLGYPSVNALCILNNYIFAGTSGFSVYRRPLSELIGIRPISEQIPEPSL